MEKKSRVPSAYRWRLLRTVGVRSIVINPSVCLSVLSVREHISEPLDRSSRNLGRSSTVTVARSSSGGVAIRYVLPVLWMTSRLAVMGRMAIAALRYRAVSDVYECLVKRRKR